MELDLYPERYNSPEPPWSPWRQAGEWNKKWSGRRWYGTSMYENGVCRHISGARAMVLAFGQDTYDYVMANQGVKHELP